MTRNADMLADLIVCVRQVGAGAPVTHFFTSQAAYEAAVTFLASLSRRDVQELVHPS